MFERAAGKVHADRLAFCSRACVDQSGRVRRGPAPTRVGCEHCAHPLDPRHGQTVCKRCRDFITLCRWLDGDVAVARRSDGDARPFVKAALIEMRGDRCEVCGFDERRPADGRSVIQMDHTDGDPTNHLVENLKLLCPNHHALTENYGIRNKGKGRAHRRERRRQSALVEQVEIESTAASMP